MTVKLKMTKQGLEQQYQKLEQLKQGAKELDKAMTRACQNSSGDGPHDNVTLSVYMIMMTFLKNFVTLK